MTNPLSLCPLVKGICHPLWSSSWQHQSGMFVNDTDLNLSCCKEPFTAARICCHIRLYCTWNSLISWLKIFLKPWSVLFIHLIRSKMNGHMLSVERRNPAELEDALTWIMAHFSWLTEQSSGMIIPPFKPFLVSFFFFFLKVNSLLQLRRQQQEK